MRILIESLIFILPAYFANMAPMIFRWIPFGNIPIDKGVIYKGRPILGAHKTWRGLLGGIVMGIVIVLLEAYLSRAWPKFSEFSLIPYGTFAIEKLLTIGFLFGFGALAGDAAKSFFKRRINIAPGKSWIPFDQLDFVIGGVFAVSFMYTPSPAHLLIIFIVSPALHMLVNFTAYSIKLQKNPL